MEKKTIIILGTIGGVGVLTAAIVTPVVLLNKKDKTEEEKTVKEILTSKTIVLNGVDAAKADSNLLSAIKSKLIKDYGLELKKAHMLFVTSKKDQVANGDKLVAITATTDDKAIKVYVKVVANDKVVEKDIEVSVRKETNAEKNKIVAEELAKAFATFKDSDSALNLATTGVTGGIDNDSEYTTGEALVSLVAKFKADAISTNLLDTWISDTGNVKITINEFDGTAAEETDDNTVDLSEAKEIKVTISSEFGGADNKFSKEVKFYVEAT